MAVATKNLRKLRHKERDFVWFVAPDTDSGDLILHVVSDDKKFLVHYVLGQRSDQALIVVIGPEFAGASTGRNHTRFRCPRFETNGIATPSAVVRLIDWCLTDIGSRQPLAWGDYPCYSYGSRPEDWNTPTVQPGGTDNVGADL